MITRGPRDPSKARPSQPPPEDDDVLAIQALTFIGGNPEHAGRFLAASGVEPTDLRRAAADPAFLLGVMDHLVGDEALLIAFAASVGVPPEAVVLAHDRLSRR